MTITCMWAKILRDQNTPGKCYTDSLMVIVNTHLTPGESEGFLQFGYDVDSEIKSKVQCLRFIIYVIYKRAEYRHGKSPTSDGRHPQFDPVLSVHSSYNNNYELTWSQWHLPHWASRNLATLRIQIPEPHSCFNIVYVEVHHVIGQS